MLREIAVGVVLGLVVLGPPACSSALVSCKLDALRVLPEDPAQATAADAADVIERLRACHRLEAPDGGP